MNRAIALQREPNSFAGGAAHAQIIVAPTLRATLAEGMSRMFAFERGGSLKSVCLSAVNIAALSWFIDSLLLLPQEASQYFASWLKGAAPEHHFTEPIIKLVAPLAAFIAIAVFSIYYAHRNARPLFRCQQPWVN